MSVVCCLGALGCPGMAELGHMVAILLGVWVTSRCVSIVTGCTSHGQGFVFPYILSSIGHCSFSALWPFWLGWGRISNHCYFVFPWWPRLLNTFSTAWSLLFLWRTVYLIHWFIYNCVIYCLYFYSYLHILDIDSLSNKAGKDFPSYCRHLSTLVTDSSFAGQNFLISCNPACLVLRLYPVLWESWSESPCLWLYLEVFYLCSPPVVL